MRFKKLISSQNVPVAKTEGKPKVVKLEAGLDSYLNVQFCLSTAQASNGL